MAQLLTVNQYAKQAGISRHTVYLQIHENRLPEGVKFKEIAGKFFIEVKS